MPHYPINNHLYTYLWNKYRPAILRLMVDAAKEPQEYKFEQHEFRDVNPKEKGGYAFTMEVFKSRPQNNIKKWVVAQDLLIILQKSAKALELLETATYEFVMDKQFVLHVKREEVVVEAEENEEEVSPEAKEEIVAEPSTEIEKEEAKEVAETAKEEDPKAEVKSEEKVEPPAKKEKEKVVD